LLFGGCIIGSPRPKSQAAQWSGERRKLNERCYDPMSKMAQPTNAVPGSQQLGSAHAISHERKFPHDRRLHRFDTARAFATFAGQYRQYHSGQARGQ
jgi:hypothetical protein